MSNIKCFVCLDKGYILVDEKINGNIYEFVYHCDLCSNTKSTKGKNYKTNRISQFNTQKIAIENKRKLGIL